MTLALIAGSVFGLGLFAIGTVMVPPRVDLAAAVGRWDENRRLSATVRTSPASPLEKLGARVAAWARNAGWSVDAQRADLAVVDSTVEKHWTSKVTLAGFGFILPSLIIAVLRLGGVTLPVSVPVALGVMLALLFFVIPDVSLRLRASARRSDLRRALACYLDLVSMCLAGGRGIPEALPSAAQVGQGWAFQLLSDTISRARYTGVSPWSALSDLGERFDVRELRDLGAALSLVADDGAKVRQSLSARAATQRKRQLAEAAGEAERGDQDIKVAQIVLAIGFLLFLAYPAVVNVLAL